MTLSELQMKMHDAVEEILGDEHTDWFLISQVKDGILTFTVDTHEVEDE